MSTGAGVSGDDARPTNVLSITSGIVIVAKAEHEYKPAGSGTRTRGFSRSDLIPGLLEFSGTRYLNPRVLYSQVSGTLRVIRHIVLVIRNSGVQ